MKNVIKKFIGILKDKINLTSQEFIKIRKKEAKLDKTKKIKKKIKHH